MRSVVAAKTLTIDVGPRYAHAAGRLDSLLLLVRAAIGREVPMKDKPHACFARRVVADWMDGVDSDLEPIRTDCDGVPCIRMGEVEGNLNTLSSTLDVDRDDIAEDPSEPDSPEEDRFAEADFPGGEFLEDLGPLPDSDTERELEHGVSILLFGAP